MLRDFMKASKDHVAADVMEAALEGIDPCSTLSSYTEKNPCCLHCT